MTPKEKAHSLIKEFTKIEFDILHTDCEGDMALASGKCTILSAQKCALITVEQIITCYNWPTYELNHWKQVKEEIKKYKKIKLKN